METENVEARTAEYPLVPVIIAWLVPGGGHLWQRRWGRGALLFGSITALFLAGLAMQGRFFDPSPANMVETLGFLGDVCSGLLFIGAKLLGYSAVASASPVADYGTKFLLVSGLLNVLCILDAYDIATGKKD
ncbi:MAG: hypothetical protein HY648_01890 [Acidobacteria bacterium]|nr:hypothetical protein [Acidobacteriota bacterium]